MPEVSEFPWCVTRMFCSFENSPPSLPRTQTRSSCLRIGHLTSVLPGGAHAERERSPVGRAAPPAVPRPQAGRPQKLTFMARVQLSWQDFWPSVNDLSDLLSCVQKERRYPDSKSCCIPECFGNKLCTGRILAL